MFRDFAVTDAALLQEKGPEESSGPEDGRLAAALGRMFVARPEPRCDQEW